MSKHSPVNKRYCTDRLRTDYAHAGLYDVATKHLWIAKKRLLGTPAVRVSHARLLAGGKADESTASKDRYMCFTYHTPGSGQGYVQGYPIEWEEGHLFVRFDPHWDYLSGQLVPRTDTARVDRNIEQQYDWARRVYQAYVKCGVGSPLSWHLLGPHPTDSLFYIERHDPAERGDG